MYKLDDKISDRIESLVRLEKRGYFEGNEQLRNQIIKRRKIEEPDKDVLMIMSESLSEYLDKKEILLDDCDLLAGHAQATNFFMSMPIKYDENTDNDKRSFEFDTLVEINTYKENHIAEEDGYICKSLDDFLQGVNMKLYKHFVSGHVIPSYNRLLHFGYLGLKELAETQIALQMNTQFANASIVVCNAASNYIMRYANAAYERIKTSPKEYSFTLSRIADSCKWISQYPPRNYFDALQLVWLSHEILSCEVQCSSLSLGRLDQYLNPYYQSDIDNKKLTFEDAGELMEAFWIKFGGLRASFQNVTIGGIKSDGTSAINDLTYLCLHACRKLMREQPLLSFRYIEDMPELIWDEIQCLIESGIGFPALLNDKISIKAMLKAGIDQDSARNYGIVGCVELTAGGKEYANTEAFRINWLLVLELILQQGETLVTKKKFPLANNMDLDSFKNFDEFFDWYKHELQHLTVRGMEAVDVLDSVYSETWPSAYLSTLMEGCLETGKDVAAGGTIYNYSVANGCGMSNTANSLEAIKRFVFEENRMRLSEFSKIMRDDFADNEKLRNKLMKYEKYGNDQESVDNIIKEIALAFADVVHGRKNLRGGQYMVGMYSVNDHVFMGELTGASADGRKSGKTLASSLAPVQGSEMSGPTSSAMSCVIMDHTNFSNGMVLDMKFHPNFFKNDRHKIAFKNLIDTYFEMGGMEIQFNVISREELYAAQKKPSEYQDLIVRVSGFSAYFTSLSKATQDDIIERTEFNECY